MAFFISFCLSLFLVNSLKCYTGKVVTSTHDLNIASSVRLENCAFSKKQCTKVTYNMTEKVNQAEVSALVVYGVCINPLAGCNLLCEQLRKSFTLNQCEVINFSKEILLKVYERILSLQSDSRRESYFRQKGKSQNVGYKKTKHANFSEKPTFFTPWYAHARVRIRR